VKELNFVINGDLPHIRREDDNGNIIF